MPPNLYTLVLLLGLRSSHAFDRPTSSTEVEPDQADTQEIGEWIRDNVLGHI